MTIMTPAFGGEIITKKGKIYKFDDLHCMISYLKTGKLKPVDIAQTLTIDYSQKQKFTDANTAFYVGAENLHSPMNSNAAAFPTEALAKQKNETIKGQVVNWQTLVTQVQ